MILIAVVSIFGTIGLFLKEAPKPPVNPLKEKIVLPDIKPQQESVKTPELIQRLNEKNARIKSISCDNVEFRIWQSGHRYKLTGKIHSEKPKNFRMQIASIMGPELDIGSNDETFWYWSRRDRDAGLHWAIHADFHKTRLKSPFNPLFLRNSFGIEPLAEDNVSFQENEMYLVPVYSMTDTRGLPIKFSVFLNKKTEQIDGYVISDNDGKIEAACEIQQYVGDIPVKILYNWCAEERTMQIVLHKPELNSVISPEIWAMPKNRLPMLDMAKD